MDSYEEQVIDDGKLEYSSICLSLPHRGEQVEKLAARMKAVGWDDSEPITLWNGVILDGRHRYEAAEIAGVKPTFQEFDGKLVEAWKYVSAHNVECRRHLTNKEKELFYVLEAKALGVRKREDSLKQNSTDISNDTTVPPSQADYADSLGVSIPTLARWEKDRKEVFENPDNSDLVEMATTPEGYTEAKKEAKSRADQIREDLSKLTPDEQVDYLGGPQTVVDQKALDNKLEKDFVPYNAALTVLNSLNRLRIYGGKKEIKSNILHALDTSARFQAYEAEALLLLAEVVEEHREELQAMCLQEVNLNKLN